MVAFAPTLANAGPQSTPGAVPAPPGLRACFAGESNALDVVSNNLGVVSGLTNYTGGKFGNAFNFNALMDGVDIAPTASTNVGVGSGMTIAAWVFPRGNMFQPSGGIIGAGPIVEFNQGAHLWHHDQQNDPIALWTNLTEGVDPSQYHILKAIQTVPFGAWRHVAVTYDKASGVMALWVNGTQVASRVEGNFTPNTATPWHIGRRTVVIEGDNDYTFNGAIDEVQLYDRGLTASEIGQLAGATGTMCVPPPVSYEVLTMPASSGESGVPFTTQPRVAILDANNNIVSNATTAVTVHVVSGGGTLLGTTTVNAVNGIATFTNLALAGAGSTVIGFTAGSLPLETGTQANSSALETIQVPRSLAITTPPGGVLTGLVLAPQPVIEIRDAANLRVIGATNIVTASIASGVGAVSGNLTATASNGTAAFSGLIIVGVGTSSLNFTSPGLTTATSGPILITGLVASQLAVVTQPGNAESGGVFGTQPVIEVRDASGNRSILAIGTVTAEIASGTGTLLGTMTVPIVNGLATFTNLKINGFGTFGLRFTSSTLTPATANLNVVQFVRQVAILSGPPTVTSGVVMTPPWLVELRDSAGLKVATSDFLTRINVASGTGALSGVTEKRAVNGVVTFDNVTVTGTGNVTFAFWVIEPNYNPWSFILTGAVTLLANQVEQNPTQLSILTAPAGAQSGSPFTTQPVIELKKADGARATTATGNVTVSLVSGAGTLMGTATVPVSNGLATFTNLQINGVGTYTLRFSYGTLAPVNANITTTPVPPPAFPSLTGVVRRGPTFNAADVTGSLQILTGEAVTLNGQAHISHKLYMPGTPTVRANGQAGIGSTVDGSGSTSPSGYQITLNGQATIGTLVRRTNPVAMPVVAPPQAPTGTRTVVLNTLLDPIGTWATVKNLTINGVVGTTTIPAGAYGDIIVNGSNTVALGVAGATTPAAYHFKSLVLNGSTKLTILGPVVITVGSQVTFNADAGSSGHPEWMTLKIHTGGLTLSGNSDFYGTVIAPSGSLILNGNSTLTGGLAVDMLTLNGNKSVLKITNSIVP
jgi:hypothetical protein